MADLVCVGTFLAPPMAEVARGILESGGIEAVAVPDDSSGRLATGGLSVGGVRLMVRQEDAQKAKDLLKEFEQDG